MTSFSSAQLDRMRFLLQRCGQLAVDMAAKDFQVYEKGVQDYVTDVDHALDVELVQELRTLFPSDGLISEENASSRSLFLAPDAPSRLWLIDPLDGTEDFIKGEPHYALMVGLLEQARAIAGWVYAPVFQQLYFGGVGLGLYQAQGDAPATPIQPQFPEWQDHCPILIGTKDLRRYGEAITQHIPEAQFNTLGSFGLKVMEVILGRAALYVYLNRRVKLWDTTGPIALAHAAGLVCCDLNGEPLRFTPDAVDSETLTHQQTILVGSPEAVERWRSPLQKAAQTVLHASES
ncbi:MULTISPECIES: inositol monophosphatase family protein [unclassified Leptolyngbya]|uniref:3'(2'),5'-bisphosphate nucleotidase CysQ family protein n=1 Tax=unclassified Leptolyngbya TaxID=2650499 RepID=UPI00168A28FB|nr:MULTISPECIES: inositol monophosphatase family protein [unclassified Leptolyngbya]MBD1910989.1 inositol monophosphatase family protein [Leptolyngbya sp. FACHB-8]MBD2158344.1 inositol monophosphatase family protein [Leptolyngbya sp. FACHB-16]